MHDYWRKQTPGKPLFADVEWSKPERKGQAGKLGIIGGNKLGFAGVAESYQTALHTGVGQARVLLPDSLKRVVPVAATDTVFAASTPSGSLAREALPSMHALADWANGILLAGDAGRNSETTLTYDDFLTYYDGQLVIMRDAVDLMVHSAHELVERDSTTLIASLAQAQKLFRAVHYPKVITFSMTLLAAVETLHKFTITYPITLAVLHKDTLIIASDGEVITQSWDSPMSLWRGITGAKIATYMLWNPKQPLHACTTAVAR